MALVEPQPVINWETFEKNALSCGVSASEATQAARYLHNIGSVVHFEEKESGLNDLVVLDR
jgi:hypothetical protein